MQNIPFFKKTKSKIFAFLFSNPHQRFHMREIERRTGERINAVREALISFVSLKLVVDERVGKKRYFQANKDGLYYDECLRIVAKNIGLGRRIITSRIRLGKIFLAFITQSFYRYLPYSETDVDLFIVGEVSLSEVSKITKEEGSKLGREINFSVMDKEEFLFRKKNNDSFLLSVLQKQRVILLGGDF